MEYTVGDKVLYDFGNLKYWGTITIVTRLKNFSGTPPNLIMYGIQSDTCMRFVKQDDIIGIYDDEVNVNEIFPCECGAEATGSPGHSSYCPRYYVEA